MIRNFIKNAAKFLLIYNLLLGLIFPSYVLALPQDGQVVGGNASINQIDTGNMHITQSSDKAIIDWGSFSIGSGEAVRFFQPGSFSVVLNRVISIDPSMLNGLLSANGKVFLINPNGITVGPTGVINVGSFMATTMNMSNEDFMAGNYRFNQVGDSTLRDMNKPLSSIINQGTITAEDGGFVVLAAPYVLNEGKIVAHLGKVYMASGEEFVLNFTQDGLIGFAVNGAIKDEIIGSDGEILDSNVKNTGEITADGGEVILSARTAYDVVKSVVNNEGIIEAKSIINKNGVIILDGGDSGIVSNSGILDVSAAEAGTDGGSVEMTGEYVGQFGEVHADAMDSAGSPANGGDINLWASDVVALSSDSLTTANAGLNGDGGEIIAFSPDTALFWKDATIEAKGGELSGDGGFIEVSGKKHVEIFGLVDASAPNGEAGTFLIDPANVEIQTVDDGNSTWGGADPNVFTPGQDSATINVATLVTNLQTANVEVTTNRGASAQAGDITVSSAITSTGTGGYNLTLQAANDIIVNAAIDLSLGSSTRDLTLVADWGGGDVASNNTGNVDINQAITLNGGTFTSSGVSFDNTGGTITTGGGDITISTDNIVLGAAVDAGAGTVTILPSNAQAIDLGTDTGGTLGITDSELDRITATTLVIGNASAGNITISNTISPSSITNLSLITGGDITVTDATSTADIVLAGAGTLSLTADAIGDTNTLDIDLATALEVTHTDTTGAGNVEIDEVSATIISTTITYPSLTTPGDLDITYNGGDVVNINSGFTFDTTTLDHAFSYTGRNSLADIGTMTLSGPTASFHANIGSADIIFDLADISAVVDFNINGSGGNLIIDNGTTALNFGTVYIGTAGIATMTVTTANNITQTGILTVTTLNVTNTGGITDLSTQSNVISNLGTITAPGGFTLDNGNNSITATGAISTTNNNITIDVGTGTFTNNASGTIDSSGGDITITTDTIVLGAAVDAGAGNILLKPSTAARTIGLSSASGDFNLTATELGYLASSGTVTIGNSSVAAGSRGNWNLFDSGQIDLSSEDFNMSFYGNDLIFTNNGVKGLTLKADKNLTINADLVYSSGSSGDMAYITLTGTGTLYIDTLGVFMGGNYFVTDIANLGTSNICTAGCSSAPYGFFIENTGDLTITGDINVTALRFTITTGGSLTVDGTLSSSQPSGTSVTSFLNLTATTGSITLNDNVTTGNSTLADTAGSDSVSSGNIKLTARTGITGSGILTTGTASLTGADAGGTDTVTSGNITLNVTGAGDAGLSGSNALTVGSATCNAATTCTATTGNIIVTSADRVNNGTVSTALDVSFGTASGGSTNTAGTLAVTTDGGAGAAGEIYITSGEALSLGVLDTADATSQNITIDTTGGANLTVTNVTEDVDGDTVEFDANTGTLTISDTAFNVAAGSLTARGDEIDFTGGANSIQGTGGTITIEAGQAATTVGINNAASTLDLSTTDIAAIQDGFTSITIGRTDATGAVTVGAGGITFNDPVTIQATSSGGTITVNGQITGSDNASVTLNSAGTTTLNANIVTAGNAITISDPVTLGTPATVTLNTTSGVPAGNNISISGAINDNAAGTSSLVLNAGTGGTVTLSSAVGTTTAINNLTITSGAAIDLPATTLSGNLSITTSGAITDSGALAVTGTTTLAAGAGNNITLNTAANNFTGAVAITSGNNVTLVDTNAIVLGASTVSGDMSVTAGSDIALNGNLTAVSNTVTLTTTGNIDGAGIITANTAMLNAATAGLTTSPEMEVTNLNLTFTGSVGGWSGNLLSNPPPLTQGAVTVNAPGIVQVNSWYWKAEEGVSTGSYTANYLSLLNPFAEILSASEGSWFNPDFFTAPQIIPAEEEELPPLPEAESIEELSLLIEE